MDEQQRNCLIAVGIIIYCFGWWVVFQVVMNARSDKSPVLRDMTYCFFWPIFLVKITIISLIRLVIDAIKVIFFTL